MAEFETAYDQLLKAHPEMIAPKATDVRTTEYTDSIELGTPSKGGALKCYINSSNLPESILRLENAYKVLIRARELMGVEVK